MTLARSTIEDAIYDVIIAAGSNTNVIFEYPNAPRPQFPYTSIKFMTVGKSINPWKQFDNAAGIVRYWECRPMTYRLHCYSDDVLEAFDEASLIQGALVKYEIRKILSDAAPMSIQSFSDILNATVLIDDAYEHRSTFDINFDVMIENGTTTEDFGYFQSTSPVEWSGI